jgi:hypothetical protein
MNNEQQQQIANSIAHSAFQVIEMFRQVLTEYERPSTVYKPKLTLDGNVWIACLGDNLQEGVVGCGDSPASAMANFDYVWYRKQAEK